MRFKLRVFMLVVLYGMRCPLYPMISRIASFVVLLSASAGLAASSPTVQFNRDIRPIVADTCFKCHGRDANARQAELRLDQREEAIKPHGDEQRIPIVPGDPSHS